MAGGDVVDIPVKVPCELSDDELFRSLPLSFIVFRIYARDHKQDAELINALNAVLGDAGDSKTNM